MGGWTASLLRTSSARGHRRPLLPSLPRRTLWPSHPCSPLEGYGMIPSGETESSWESHEHVARVVSPSVPGCRTEDLAGVLEPACWWPPNFHQGSWGGSGPH